MSQASKSCKSLIQTLILIGLTCYLASQASSEESQSNRPWLKNRRLATRAQPIASSPNNKPITSAGTGSAVEVPLPNQPIAVSAPLSFATSTSENKNSSTSRSARTAAAAADIFDKDYNIIVTNTCERESMKVNIEVSKPFYGVIHTRNQRQKQVCSIEGNGDQKYSLEINNILNSNDPNYCGVIRARRDSVEDKDVLSVVIAVRVHRNIELSDDKFFLLNCTNRCRKSDCSKPTNEKLTDLSNENNGETENSNRQGERENPIDPNALDRNPGLSDECTIWKFPWVITLLWCLGILLLAMIISHCIMCSSLVCRCVKTEVEETESSIYESDDDRANNKKNNKNNKSPYTIDYDNRDIYKTSNNYAPYSLEEAQTRRKNRKDSR